MEKKKNVNWEKFKGENFFFLQLNSNLPVYYYYLLFFFVFYFFLSEIFK